MRLTNYFLRGSIMKKRPNILMVALLFVFAFFLAACGNDGGENGNADINGEEPVFMNNLTGRRRGTYYLLGGAMVSDIEDETDILADDVSSNAMVDNAVVISDSEAVVVMVQTHVMAGAVDGINSFHDQVNVDIPQVIVRL